MDSIGSGRFYLVGGGIASLAAAAFLIRDGAVPGRDITIFEASDRMGGSLDGAGDPESGYVIRGGRMFESKYVCTYDLFSSIPTMDGSKTVTQEIFDQNGLLKTSSKSRIFRNGKRQNAPRFGLSEAQTIGLECLFVEPEWMLDGKSICDLLDPEFFLTDFWIMWSTTFAFQPWHSAIEFKRYLLRFIHMVRGFNRLRGIMRTEHNQYDSLVLPLKTWLKSHGVNFALGTQVTDLSFRDDPDGFRVESIKIRRADWVDDIRVRPVDSVFVTLGSMTEDSRLGSMDSPAPLEVHQPGGAWALWKRMESARPSCFGRPDVFCEHIDESRWLSFTTTLHGHTLFDIIRDLTGNIPGEGGLITFADSNWLLSIVLPRQPHFLNQPENVDVMWGYGLQVDLPGNFVDKPLSACSGREIMTEILGHLGIQDQFDAIMSDCNCIPCMMPYITSQFLRRAGGDRPHVIPARSKNLALIGQFCEVADDVVFTVEYSVRSAQTAVYSLLNLNREPPPIFKGQRNLQILMDAVLALHDKAFRG